MNSDINKLLSYCSDFDLNISEEQAALCIKHLNLVIEKNKQVNLTRILNRDEALVLHILDSLLLLDQLEGAPKGRFLDMGTGAGFPGIPLAIASGRPAVLIDSVGKKINAVNDFCKELCLEDVVGVHTRLEDGAKTYRGSISAVVARALASLPVLCEYASPYLVKHGLFIVTKGNPSEDELESGIKAADICGLKLVQKSSFDLPLDLGHRETLVFEKYKPASLKLPRQNGLARKKPLA